MRCSPIFPSQGEGDIGVELSGEAPPKQKRGSSNNNPSLNFLRDNKDEQVATIFHLLSIGNKLKLPEVQCPNEVGHTSDPNYYSSIGWSTIY